MDDYNIRDYKNILILRNQLETIGEEELIEIYQDIQSYQTFLNSIGILANVDSAFLYYKNQYIRKIERIISIHRFDVSQEYQALINDIITYLNEVKSTSEEKKSILMNGYFAYQEDIRKRKFKNYQEMLSFESYDAQVVYGLELGQLDFLTDSERLISSLNYLLETIPELFTSEEDISLLINHLNKLCNSKGLFQRKQRKNLKIVQKKLRKDI